MQALTAPNFDAFQQSFLLAGVFFRPRANFWGFRPTNIFLIGAASMSLCAEKRKG